jgi:hypothetical protein
LHYHLLVETPKANLSIGMRQLNRIFTQKFPPPTQTVRPFVSSAFQGDLGGTVPRGILLHGYNGEEIALILGGNHLPVLKTILPEQSVI